MTQDGFGARDGNFTPERIVTDVKHFYIYATICNAVVTMVKAGLCGKLQRSLSRFVVSGCCSNTHGLVFYLRFAVEPWSRKFLYGILTVVSMMGMFITAIWDFQCIPVSYTWTKFSGTKPDSGHCLPDEFILVAAYVQAAITALLDWTLALFPVVLLWNVRMSWRTKVSICSLLMFGAVASGSTLARLAYTKYLHHYSEFVRRGSSWMVWSTVEIGLVLLASGFAVSLPLIRRLNDMFKRTKQVENGVQQGQLSISRARSRTSSTSKRIRLSKLPRIMCESVHDVDISKHQIQFSPDRALQRRVSEGAPKIQT